MPRYVLHVIDYSLHKGTVFDWGELISNELSHQLSNFQKTKRIFMASYLIYALISCNTFSNLSPKADVDMNELQDTDMAPKRQRKQKEIVKEASLEREMSVEPEA